MKQRFETLCIIIEVTFGAADEAVSSAPSIPSVDADMADTTLLAVDSAAPVGDTGTSQSPSSPHPFELAAAMQAMTAAAERLASAAARIEAVIEAAVQTQRCEQSQQPQQIMSGLPDWQMHGYWQHVMLRQQQQQQQQRLVYYQQQQVLYWQQLQQQTRHFRWQCGR
jgi:hypothetical protein